ncbi:MAG: ankyrin repeat domain-containing protein [Akkermansiaceae bacterium]|nr:ankyrin repeat domain-containing protein [Akkermansiaceae bacterium]
MTADLGKAVENGDVNEVRRLLDGGADPNRRIPDSDLEHTALFLAVKGDKPEITKTLLEAGADPRIEDENGDPVMVYAADAERVEHARLLIQHGVGINSRSSSGSTCLIRGARYEKTADVRAKLDLGADPDLVDPRGHTALMIATGAGNMEAVEQLLKGGADPDVTTPNGKTALTMAAAIDSFDGDGSAEGRIIKWLLGAGADIDHRDSEGNTPLLVALKNWQAKPPMIEALLAAKPDLSIRDAEGRDALFLAVSDEDTVGFFERLVDLGADIRTTDDSSVDLLMLAAGHADRELVSDLLKRGLDPMRVTKAGWNAVHHVASIRFYLNDPFGSDDDKKRNKKDIPGVLDLLREQGLDIMLRDKDGDSPLHVAAAVGNAPAVEWLVNHSKTWDEKNGSGESPLHLAATGGTVECVGYLLPKVADIDGPDAEGRTPLARAVAVDDRGIIQLLVERGADINQVGADESSLLSAVLARGEFDLARFLVELGADPRKPPASTAVFHKVVRQFHDVPTPPDDYAFAVALVASTVGDVNESDSEGVTSLMWVASSNVVPALDAVLERNPDLNARSRDGRTALMWAAVSGADGTFNRLENAGAEVTLKDHAGRTAADWRKWFTDSQTIGSSASSEVGEPVEELIGRVRRTALQEYVARGHFSEEDRIAGTAPLHLAASLGEVDALKSLLDAGAEIDSRMPGGVTALMEAAANGRMEAVQYLLGRGADPTLRDARKSRALDHAIDLKHLAVAGVLLKLPGVIGDDELQLLKSLIALGDADLLKKFLDAGLGILPADRRPKGKDLYGRPVYRAGSVLAAAAVHNDDSLLRVLADYPEATGAAEPNLLATALHRAAEAGRLDNVRFLVENLNVDPGVELNESFGGVTRIIGGDEREKLKPLEAYTPLSRALEEGENAVVRYLLEKGAKPTGRTRSGAPPATFAVVHRRVEMLEILLEHGAELEVVDFSGLTALHHAAESNDRKMIEFLLKHGADRGAKDPKGRTPLDRAREADAGQAVEALSS